jgi:hypothetical protein
MSVKENRKDFSCMKKNTGQYVERRFGRNKIFLIDRKISRQNFLICEKDILK